MTTFTIHAEDALAAAIRNGAAEAGRGSIAGMDTTAAQTLAPEAFRAEGLGVALGSGGARGLAHVGVLQELLARGAAPRFVAGTSMGALVGAAYAAGNFGKFADALGGMDVAAAAALFLDFGFAEAGLVRGRRVMEFLSSFVPPDAEFEELPVPFAAMATDVSTGEAVMLRSGNVLEAVRASISIPGVFAPVKRGGALLVDGGMSSPVPVAAARALGARRVLAVNVDNRAKCPYATHRLPNGVNKAIGMGERLRDAVRRELGFADARGQGVFDMLSRTVRVCEDRIAQWEVAREKPEWAVEPAVGDIPTLDFSRVDDAVRAGRDAAAALFA